MPPGTSETPATSPRSSARSGQRRETTATTVLPAASAGATSRIEPEQVGLVGRQHGDDAGRLGRREATGTAPATGLMPPITAASLSVQPA